MYSSFFFPFRSDIGEEVLVDCLKYVDLLLDRVPDHVLVDQLFSKNKELCKIVILSANKRLSLGYVNRTLKLAVRVLQLGKFLFLLIFMNNIQILNQFMINRPRITAKEFLHPCYI